MTSSSKSSGARLVAAMAGVAVLTLAGPGQALTIAPTFDSSITSSPNAAAIEAAINQVTQTYRMFSNPAKVSIDFQLGNLGGPGGESLFTLYEDSYAGYEFGALAHDAAANPWNHVLATAQANLAAGNTADNILGTSANFRALGYIGADGLLGSDGLIDGTFDGIVLLDAASVQAGLYSFAPTVGPGQYSGLDILYHEVDEVLGIGGAGSTLNFVANGIDVGGMGPLDPYRYDYFTGLKSFTTDPNTIAYFSIDGGKTAIAPFNQINPPGFSGDYADWGRFACDDGLHSIQEWAGCGGEPHLPFTSTGWESTALQSIGYNMVPEPGIWTLMILGLGGAGLGVRRRRLGGRLT
jgi:hypothetical protein